MTSITEPLHVCIEGRLVSGKAGGVETVVIGIAQGFRELDDDSLRLTFLVYEGAHEWLAPHLRSDWCVVTTPAPLSVRWGPRLGPFAGVARSVRQRLEARRSPQPEVPPPSPGVAENSGAQVMHFPFQSGFLTDLPTVYQPHDLQHRHLPQFFTAEQHEFRERMYGGMCRRADAVVVGTSWVKQDLIDQMAVPEDKIHVVPLAPVTNVDAGSDVPVTGPSGVPEGPFALYPAATWAHKNHLHLLAALAALKTDGVRVPLVLTGAPTERDQLVRAEVVRLGLQRDVTHLGFVPPNELEALYRAARLVVIPTLFEAASFPIWEAFRLGVPVACSHVTSLPRQVDGAAVVFDPTDVSDIIRALRCLWNDEALRRSLAEQGQARVAQFSWLQTARGLRAVYRKVGSSPLSDEDRALLAQPPII